MVDRNRVRDVGRRVLAALAVGFVTAATAYCCAFFNMRGHPNYRIAQEYTQAELNWLQEAVQKHRQVTGQLPAALTELAEVKQGRLRPVDVWENPYQYHARADGFTLFSLGRDGQPGGDGCDADIYPSSEGHALELPTLWQFTFNLPTEGVQWTCLLAGVCAALVCLLPSRNRMSSGFLVRVGATMIGATLVAAVISYLHIPTGH